MKLLSTIFAPLLSSQRKMADERETNLLLYRIANEMRAYDLQNLKHLCHGQIPLGELEKAQTSNDLFRSMLQKRLIKPGNLSVLVNMLTRIGRADLAAKINTSGDATMQTESAMGPVVTIGPMKGNYRGFLMKLSDELTKDNVESLKFVANLPGMYLQMGRACL